MGMNLNHHNTRIRRNRYSLNSEINVTPFVDVMLVLLVIFMVTSPMLVAGVHVDLPETSASPVAGQDEPLSIVVDAKGQVYLQDAPVAMEELSAKLKAVTKEKLDTRIFVSGDKGVEYGKVIGVMDAITQAGFAKVALITNIAPDKTRRN